MIRCRRLPLLLSLGLILCAGLSPLMAAGTTAQEAPAPPQASADSPSQAWLGQVQQDIAAQEYEITWQEQPAMTTVGAAWHAPNRAHDFRTYFTAGGIRVVPRQGIDQPWDWGLSLVAYGQGSRRWPVPEAKLSPTGKRMDYSRGGIEEWYINDARGLEQGFELHAAPAEIAAWSGTAAMEGRVAPPGAGKANLDGDRANLVFLDLELSGNLMPVVAADGQAIDFVVLGGARVLRYAKLQVTDATGRQLAAWMEGVADETVRGVRIVVNTADAVYPITVDPLATSPAWTAESDQADARFGWSVATAGDVNGDGYSDVIVGAHFYDNGEDSEGRAFVYLGSVAGLAATAGWTAESDQANAFFGDPVATAGDVNGDGYADIIIGATGYDNGHSNEGRAFVYHGSAAGLETSPAWTAESNQGVAFFGRSVATAGDVNGDGYADVIVGANNYDNGESGEGRAFVYLGSAAGLAGGPNAGPLDAAWTAESNQADAAFGMSVATAGDVNGDGFADVIVGASQYTNGESAEGRVYVYLGAAAGLAGGPNAGPLDAAWSPESDEVGARFGNSVATAGDVNGDGYADVIVGVKYYANGQTNEGRAVVYLGSSAGLAPAAAWAAESNQSNALFGISVASAGDVNGDGYADVIVGAIGYDNVESNEGRAFVYLGSAAGLPGGLTASPLHAAWTTESNQVGAELGISVATAGDVNGDGYADVIVGAYYYDNVETDEGRAFVYLGSATGLATTAGWAAESDVPVANFGYSVATAGDVNGDGYADVIVGARQYDNGENNEGGAFVYLGSAAGLATTAAWTVDSDQVGADFGISVATAGDVNGDGYADVIIGSQEYDNGENNEGRAFVYLGSAAGLASTAAWTAEGNQAAAYFGSSVATAGDVNGDGFADFVVGSYTYDNGEDNEGRAFLYLGAAAGLSNAAAWMAEGDRAAARFGSSVATAGDVNGDGYADVIVGAGGYNNRGMAFVYLGSAAGLATTAAWTVESDQSGAEFGDSAATAGDINGDGYADVIIGAYAYDNGEITEGRAFVYLGSAAGLAATPAWFAEGNEIGAMFGRSVATAGDVNGDGYADVVVGANQYDNGEDREGRAFVYLGSAAGLAATPAWFAESNQAIAFFGRSVATAGDVNGDGYADVIVGASRYDNGESDEGRAFVYYGNAGAGLSVRPQQRRVDDLAPIAPGGWSDGRTGFRLAALGRNSFGRGRVKLQWEVKPLGAPFDGSGTGQSAAWVDTGTAGASLNETVTGLAPGVNYHWRVRLLYDSVSSPFQHPGRWFTVPWAGWSETDLGTRLESSVSLTQTDVDPVVPSTGNLEYTLNVANAGPDAAEAVMVSDTLPAGTVFVSATPSQGSCSESGGEVTCSLGTVASGSGATIVVVATATAPGVYTNLAGVMSSSRDANMADNSASEDTTVLEPRIGGLVWEDRDGDGIRGAAEPRIGGILVELLDSGGTPIDLTLTASDGSYGFPVSTGVVHRVRFEVPSGWVFTTRDQGTDDALDSDADIFTGETSAIGPVIVVADRTRWSSGLRRVGPCFAPDEPVYMYNVRLSTDGNDYTILDFMEFNQPEQLTGYNVYRSSDPGLDPGSWPLVASDVIDGDESTPNKQWVDTSGDEPPGGIWYYDVAAYNSACDAEGPR